MRSDETSECTTAGTRVRRPQYVRYGLPCGLVEEVLHEAQQRNISPSAVVAAVLAQSLSSFAADGVASRIQRAVQPAMCDAAAIDPVAAPSILPTTHAAQHTGDPSCLTYSSSRST